MLLNDPPRSIVAALRSATGGDHDRVDAAYGDFDLAAPDSYRAFLHAHARALPAAEDALAAVPGLPHFRPRTPLLAADLGALDEAMPPPHAEPQSSIGAVMITRSPGMLSCCAIDPDSRPTTAFIIRLPNPTRVPV
jgi:hypothetical protein